MKNTLQSMIVLLLFTGMATAGARDKHDYLMPIKS